MDSIDSMDSMDSGVLGLDDTRLLDAAETLINLQSIDQGPGAAVGVHMGNETGGGGGESPIKGRVILLDNKDDDGMIGASLESLGSLESVKPGVEGVVVTGGVKEGLLKSSTSHSINYHPNNHPKSEEQSLRKTPNSRDGNSSLSFHGHQNLSLSPDFTILSSAESSGVSERLSASSSSTLGRVSNVDYIDLQQINSHINPNLTVKRSLMGPPPPPPPNIMPFSEQPIRGRGRGVRSIESHSRGEPSKNRSHEVNREMKPPTSIPGKRGRGRRGGGTGAGGPSSSSGNSSGGRGRGRGSKSRGGKVSSEVSGVGGSSGHKEESLGDGGGASSDGNAPSNDSPPRATIEINNKHYDENFFDEILNMRKLELLQDPEIVSILQSHRKDKKCK